MTAAATTLLAALVAALSEMPNPVKNADNPAFKRGGKPMKYADLESTLDVCKPVLAKHGIALMQMPVSRDGELGVHTVLIGHGEQMDCGDFVLPLEGPTPQKAAGAITYARRYALTAIFGLAQEDDDANAASNPGRASEATVTAAFGKARALGMSDDALFAAVRRDFGHDHPADLSPAQMATLLDKMQAAIDKEASKDAA